MGAIAYRISSEIMNHPLLRLPDQSPAFALRSLNKDSRVDELEWPSYLVRISNVEG
jgi:hypothetical protein